MKKTLQLLALLSLFLFIISCTSDDREDADVIIGSWEVVSARTFGDNCGGTGLEVFVPNETNCETFPDIGTVCPAACWVFEAGNRATIEFYSVFTDDDNRKEKLGEEQVQYTIVEPGKISLCAADGTQCEIIEYDLNNDDLTLRFFVDCEAEAGFKRK